MDGAAKLSAEAAKPGFWQRLRARLRFGLGGLVLFVLFLGSLAAVWVRWEAWVFSSNTKISGKDFWPEGDAKTDQENEKIGNVSPDGTRAFLINRHWYISTVLPGTIAIAEIRERGNESHPHILVEPQDRLCLLPCPDPSLTEMEVVGPSYRFVDDDHIQLTYGSLEHQFFVADYRRRHPEWWWGHFYRPEVWVATVLGLLWLWRVIKALRRKPQAAA